MKSQVEERTAIGTVPIVKAYFAAAAHMRVLCEERKAPVNAARLQDADATIVVRLITARFHPMTAPLRMGTLRTIDFIISKTRWSDCVFLNSLPTMLRYDSNAPGFARAHASFQLPPFFFPWLNLLLPLVHSCGGSPGCAAGESTAASCCGVISLPADRVFSRRSAFPRLGLNSGAGEAYERRGGNAIRARAALARGTPPHG